MRYLRVFLVSAAVLAVVGMYGVVRAAEEKEEKVALDQLPKPVVEAVKKRFPDAEIKSAEKEEENGKTEYEVAINDKGHKREVTVTPEGTLVEIENRIEAKDMPKAVADALDQKYPKATLKSIEEVVKVREGKEKLEYYEIHLVTAEGKKMEVTLTPEGKTNKEEDKSKEKG
jgi:uncharacterized membrane protein YkoI